MRGLLATAVILALLPYFSSAVHPAQAQSSPPSAGHLDQSSSDIDATVAHALEFTSAKLLAKVRNTGLTFHWIGQSDRFWYRKSVGGSDVEFMVVDATTGKQSFLFDAGAMTTALAKAGLNDSATSSIRALEVQDDGRSVVVSMKRNGATCRWPQSAACDVDESRYQCDLPISACKLAPESSGIEIMSPDYRNAAFVRDHNLWIRNIESGTERDLTREGVENFAYGSLLEQFSTNEVYRRRAGLPKPLEGIAWSPDGKYVLALRHDLRNVPARLAVTEYLPPEGGMPIVHMVRQAITTDAKYPDASLDVVDIATGTVHRADVDPQMLTYQTLGYVWWTDDSKKAWLIEVDRRNREERLVSIDVPDGRSHVSVVETAQHSLRRGAATPSSEDENATAIAVLSSGREVIWYSERDGWGHLYLHDATTGAMRRQITKGHWVVADLLRIDEKTRTLFFTAVGREPGRDPYYRFLYRVSLDGGEPVLLTPENADHDFQSKRPGSDLAPGGSISPDGRYIVDTYSTITEPDKTVLRKIDGKAVASVIEADVSELTAFGWHPPEGFVVKADDGTTDLYGALYKPKNFDSSKKYPVIEIYYPGNFARFSPKMFREEFTASAALNAYAFAETGAIVVGVDGRGTPYRSLAFRSAFDSNCEDQHGAVDHVAAIRHLAAARPYIDLSRVGVTGHSTGGYSTVHSILLFPDFYTVAVAGEVVSDWLTISGSPSAEARYGIPDTPEVLDCYRRASNEYIADRLKGRLLIIVAGADEDARFQQSMGVFAALQKANKSYDTIVIPDAPHIGGRLPYGVFQTVKYFVRNLGGPQ
jgi:dipeptidyl-peptidase-4